MISRSAVRTATLETPRLSLSAFTAADLPAFLAYRNRPEVARYQSWETITPRDAALFLEGQRDVEPGRPGRWFQFAVHEKPEAGLIGDIGLHVEAEDARLAEIGFTFDPAFQGRGLATEAVSAVLDLAFADLEIHRVKAIVDRDNPPAIRLCERLRMRREAHFVQHTWFKGAWCDEFLYAMLASEWKGT